MTDAPEPPTRRDPLWAELADRLRWLAATFGEPGELWEEIAVRRRIGLALRAWLRGLEAIARALLVTLAVREFWSAEAVRPAKPSRKNPSTDELTEDDHERGLQSERWIDVRFALLPRAQGPRRGDRLPPKGWLRQTFETRALAFRFEALIRVAEAPERYARRMARLLRAAPDAAKRILEPPPDERPKNARSYPRADVREAQAAARAALAALDSG